MSVTWVTRLHDTYQMRYQHCRNTWVYNEVQEETEQNYNIHVYQFRITTHMYISSELQHTCISVQNYNTHVHQFRITTHKYISSELQHTCT